MKEKTFINDIKKINIEKITKQIISVNLSMSFPCYSLSLLAGLSLGDTLQCDEELRINLEAKELDTKKQFIFRDLDNEGKLRAELEL